MSFIKKYWVLLGVVCLLFIPFILNLSGPRGNKPLNKEEWEIIQPANLNFKVFNFGKSIKNVTRPVIPAGTKVIPIDAGNKEWIKVQLPTGEFGYININKLDVGTDVYTKKSLGVFDRNSKNGSKIGEVAPNDHGRIMEFDEKKSMYTKVAFDNGTMGWVSSFLLQRDIYTWIKKKCLSRSHSTIFHIAANVLIV